MGNPEALDRISFLVLDNHPEGPDAEHLKGLDDAFPDLRYVPFRGFRSRRCATSSSVKRTPTSSCAWTATFFCAQGPGLPSSIGSTETAKLRPNPGAVPGRRSRRSLRHSLRSDMGRGDVRAVGKRRAWIRPQRRTVRDRDEGLGVFACRREAWPGLTPLFRGFGGEEGYLQQKFRRAGGRVYAIRRSVGPIGSRVRKESPTKDVE